MSRKKKNAAKLKELRLQQHTPKEVSSTAPPGLDDEDDELPAEDLQIAVDTLQILCEEPERLAHPRYKALKRAGWDFGKVLADQGSAAGSSIHSKISHALSLSHYRQALVLLFEMHVNRTPAKLGAIQRWVRDCDATSDPERVPTPEEREERDVVLRCLDLVLRVCGNGAQAVMGLKGLEAPAVSTGTSSGGAAVARMGVWDVRRSEHKARLEASDPLWTLIDDGSQAEPAGKFPSSSVIQVTPGPLRKPPNVYPSTVHATSSPSPIAFPACTQPTFSVPHPHIPQCSMVCNVLPPSTCRSIIDMANTLGWEADEAAGGSAVAKSSVLAHNVVWLADEDFTAELYRRILPFVQQKVKGAGSDGLSDAGRVRGINRRFRIYRYGSKQVYRPHIDGAWPAAGLDPDTGEYMHDSSPIDDPLWSRYTILIYLNDDINASSDKLEVPGATTFFIPSPGSLGQLLAFPIAPVQGAVLLFPHGDSSDSLLHEGSPVGASGWKVIIRTDLLYSAEGFGEFAPSKKRKVLEQADEINKIVKVVGQNGDTIRERVIPKAMGESHLGEGSEGIGG